jgi:hypothetical protein
MNMLEIENYLSTGGRLGVIASSYNPNCFRWILVSKHVPNARMLEALAAGGVPNILDEQRSRIIKP